MGAVAYSISYDDVAIRDAVDRLAEFGEAQSHAMWDAIGAAMVSSTQLRFRAQHGPDGEAWKPSQRALRTGTATLIEHGYLLASLTHNVTEDGVEWGSALVYAAIQQAGGTIHREAHEQSIFRKAGKDGLSAKFVKKKQSNFEQRVHVGAYDIDIPARPYLGIDQTDEATIESIAQRHMEAALLGTSPAGLS